MLIVRQISCKANGRNQVYPPTGVQSSLSTKRKGYFRVCIDFRILNKQIIINLYPTPQINDTLDCLCKAGVFSTIDLSKVYHQVIVEPSHIHIRTALSLHKYILFKSLVLPFRLVNAPSNILYWLINTSF